MKRARRGAKEALLDPEMNLTPLIDVVFVILIAFIMIAPLLEVDNVELAEAPNSSTKNPIAATETSPIAIHVRQDNSIYYNGKKVSLKELLPKLQEAKRKYPKTTPQIFHDKKAHFGTYQSVKNTLEEAGFEKVDIILNPS